MKTAPPRLPPSRRYKALIHQLNWMRDYMVENSLAHGRGTKMSKMPSGTTVEASPAVEESTSADEPIWL
jgi:hypothetical protein